MNKKILTKKGKALLALCFALAFGIRIFLLVSGEVQMRDDFQFYQASLVRPEGRETVMTSGIACVYTESLSAILKFTGNKIEAAAVYHIVLQIASFFFLFFSFLLLFGKIPAFLAILWFSFSPNMIRGIFGCSPESLYLSALALCLLAIGIYFRRVETVKNNLRWCYLPLIGFLMGILCIWHNTGFLLMPVALYAFIRNAAWMGKKGKLTELMALLAGTMLGASWMLLAYTIVTENTLREQFLWWTSQLHFPVKERWQDMEIWLPIWLISAFLLGAGAKIIAMTIHKKDAEENHVESRNGNQDEKGKRDEKTGQDAVSDEMGEMTIGAEKSIVSDQPAGAVRPDAAGKQKEIHYLENPLPLPKKHVKRDFDFKLKDYQKDFDIEISEDDDFDI